MAVILAPDAVELFAPGGMDPHGWRLPGDLAATWRGRGSLQLAQAASDPRATAGGGHGPHDPRSSAGGTLFLPAEAEPRNGMTALVRGGAFVLSAVRYLPDPIGSGLDCYVAAVTEAPAESAAS